LLVTPLGQSWSASARAALSLLLLTVVAISAFALIRHVQAQQERLNKRRLTDELNARAELMRRNPLRATPTITPVVTHPEALLSGQSDVCPLGANSVRAGAHTYCIDVYEYPGGKAMPRTNISFTEASRICHSRGERLCTDSEWEYACRGKGGTSYPYGQIFDAVQCNTQGGEVAPAGSFTGCRSGSGAYDMSGNVAEWVVSGAQRGGSAMRAQGRCSTAVRPSSNEGSVAVGVRCCSDPVFVRAADTPR
jgi:hypothetical protein